MISRDCIITVNGNKATIDSDIYLYKYDKNIQLAFTIINSKYMYDNDDSNNLVKSMQAAYAQVKFKKNDSTDIEIEFPIQATNKGAVLLTITGELIDEDTELGEYTIQIRLLDVNKNSVVTLPPVESCIHILAPLFEKLGADTNEVNKAIVNKAVARYSAPLSATTGDGTFNSKNWVDGDKITTAELNRMEEGIKTNSTQYKDIASKLENGNIGNTIEPALMDMPRIYFSEGTLPTSKTATMLKFDYYSKTKEYHGWAEIKCQGNSSMSYPKKNFTIKLYKDKAKTTKLKIDFKGWGKQSKFVLKANWIDLTHARNIVSARIWSDIVKSRANYSSLPELLRTSPNQGVIDGFPVTIYGNGYYQGRYTLNIPKDKWMSNMDDTLDTHCILCGENYVSGCFRALPVINGSDWTDELHDTVPATIKTSWTNVVKFVMNSSDSEFKANLNNYIDVNSLIDYLLYGIVSTGLDAFGKNQIYMTYDGTKWFASMYDMDSTWGLWWNGQKFVSSDYAREDFQDLKDEGNGVTKQGNLLYLRLQKLFITEIKARYTELRQNIFTYPYLVNKFEEFIQICPQDIVKEDYASTTANNTHTGIPSKTTNNIQQLRNNINARLTYVDGYINSLVEAKPCTAISLNKTTLSFTTLDAQTLTATVTPTDTTDKVTWSVTPAGICTVENGVVTPIKNGSCVITATCGTQKATCNITVDLPSVACTSITLNKNKLQLGNIQGTQPDTDTNLLEGLTWKDGQINDINGSIMQTGTDKYIVNIPISATGLYRLSRTINYNFLKLLVFDSNNKVLHADVNSINGDASIYVYEPNCYGAVSVFPNSLEFDANNVALKYVHNLANTPNIDIDIQASAIANMNLLTTYGEYDIIELYADDEYMEIAALKLGNTIYKIYNFTKQSLSKAQGDVSVARTNTGYCTKGSWNGKTFFNIAVPSTWGATKEDIANYIQTNNIAIVMNPSEYLNSADETGNMTLNNYQLKATVEPSNCTDSIIWSTSPEGIVTVKDGLVTAFNTGETTVTATCGTKSATCTVTSNISNAPVYTLPKATTFDGTNYIDTGVQLFDSPKDFTIFVDFTPTAGAAQADNASVFHCIHEQVPYRGLCLSYSSSYYIGGQDTEKCPGHNYCENLVPGKYLIEFKQGRISKVKNVDGDVAINSVTLQSTYVQVTENLLLGAYQTTNGQKGRYWKGTINKFKVWFRTLTDEEINTLLGKNIDEVKDGYLYTNLSPDWNWQNHRNTTSTIGNNSYTGYECPDFFNDLFAFDTDLTSTTSVISDEIVTENDTDKITCDNECIAGAKASGSNRNFFGIKLLSSKCSNGSAFRTYLKTNPIHAGFKLAEGYKTFTITSDKINNPKIANTNVTGFTVINFGMTVPTDLITPTSYMQYCSNFGILTGTNSYITSFDGNAIRFEQDGSFTIKISQDLLTSQDADGLIAYINKNPITIYYI